MKTFSAKPAEVKHEWFVIDATDKVLGRVASEAALRLRGKHKAIYTPHVDTGDFIVVVNADKIRVTGSKATDKIYYRHSGYPGGIYATPFKDMQAKHPGRALEKAVKGMLPKGPLGYAMVKKLKVYAGASTRTPRSSPSRWRSEDAMIGQLELRHRPPQVERGPRLHEEGQRPDRHQRQAHRRYFGRQTSIMIVKQPLLLTANDGGLRHQDQRARRRRIRPGRRGAPRHHACADRLRRGAQARPVAVPASSRAMRARSSARRSACTARAAASSSASADPERRGHLRVASCISGPVSGGHNMRWKLLRRRLSVSAPRMIVRSHLPWPLRWAALAVMLGFSAAMALWAFELGKRDRRPGPRGEGRAGPLRAEVSRCAPLRERAATGRYRRQPAQGRTRRAGAAGPAGAPARDADKQALQDDLGFFERLVPASGEGCRCAGCRPRLPRPASCATRCCWCSRQGRQPSFGAATSCC
jgi:large subunit ribosomal protein L13